jgi:hypothetical protein
MANWCNIRLSVFGTADDLAPFRRAAGALKGRINTAKSSIFTPAMEWGETRDLEAAEVKPFGRRFQRAEYLFQGRNDDYADHFREVSARYPSLAIVLTFGDPNFDLHGSHVFLNSRQRTWTVGARLHRQLMMKHYGKWKLLDARGHVDYDSESSDWAEWDAFFEMMDIAAVHWDVQVLKWLRDRHPVRRRPGSKVR